MKAVKFLLRTFFVLLILFFVAATIYVRIYGKSLVEEALNVSLKRNVVLRKATYHFPLGFRAYNVQIAQSLEGGELLKIKKVIAQLSSDAIFERKFSFDLVFLIEPSLVVKGAKNSSDNKQGQAESSVPEKSEGLIPAGVESENKEIEVSIKKLIVRKGYLQYEDGITEKGFSFDLEDVQLKAEQLVFPLKPGKTGFDMSARLAKKGNPLSGSHVTGSGWIDALNKNMEAKVEVIEADGKIGLTADALSLNNDMEVKGDINIQNLLWGVNRPSSDASAVNDLVLNALSSSGVEIGASFAFKAKMDNFRVGKISFSGNVVTK